MLPALHSNRRCGQGSLPTTAAETQDLEIDDQLEGGHASSHGSVVGHILIDHPMKANGTGTVAEGSKASIHIQGAGSPVRVCR